MSKLYLWTVICCEGHAWSQMLCLNCFFVFRGCSQSRFKEPSVSHLSYSEQLYHRAECGCTPHTHTFVKVHVPAAKGRRQTQSLVITWNRRDCPLSRALWSGHCPSLFLAPHQLRVLPQTRVGGGGSLNMEMALITGPIQQMWPSVSTQRKYPSHENNRLPCKIISLLLHRLFHCYVKPFILFLVLQLHVNTDLLLFVSVSEMLQQLNSQKQVI